MADYKKIVQSPPFTFFVGLNSTPLTIHAAIVQDISEPLYRLIYNGHMKESITGSATLEDVEVDTFIGFCEYAYKGVYETPNFASDQYSEDDAVPTAGNEPDQSSEISTNNVIEPAPTDYPEPYMEPEPMPEPEAPAEPEPWSYMDHGIPKKKKNKNMYVDKIEEYPAPVITPITVVYPYEQLWNQFRSMKFSIVPGLPSPNPDILFHAKLYVFATKLLIGALREQCLHSLHRDLCAFSLNRESMRLIFDLFTFTYANTGRQEPEGKCLLRDMVIHYVACEVRTLSDDESFSDILDCNGEMASDLVIKLAR